MNTMSSWYDTSTPICDTFIVDATFGPARNEFISLQVEFDRDKVGSLPRPRRRTVAELLGPANSD